MDTINMVKEFHESFEHLISESPCIPPMGLNNFRAEFMAEEAKETMKACAENNLIELADGLGDLQYVLDGWFLNAGLHDKKEAILAEIHRSNMTKMCRSIDEAEESKAQINANLEDGNDAVDYKEAVNGSGYIIFRVRDGKIGKSIYYEKPNLHPIIYGTAL